MPFEFERDYVASELVGRYDFSGYPFFRSTKNRDGWLSVLQFNFDRIVRSDQTAQLDLVAICENGERILLQAEAKFFASIQRLDGFRYFAVCLALVRSDESQLWTKDETKFEIVKLRLTNHVNDEVAGIKFNM